MKEHWSGDAAEKEYTTYTKVNLLAPNVNESGRAVGPLNSRMATKFRRQNVKT